MNPRRVLNWNNTTANYEYEQFHRHDWRKKQLFRKIFWDHQSSFGRRLQTWMQSHENKIPTMFSLHSRLLTTKKSISFHSQSKKFETSFINLLFDIIITKQQSTTVDVEVFETRKMSLLGNFSVIIRTFESILRNEL